MKLKKVISCVMVAAILMTVCLMSVSAATEAYSAMAELRAGDYYAKTAELGNVNGEGEASGMSTNGYSCKVSLMAYEGSGGARSTVGSVVFGPGREGTTTWLSTSKPWLYGYMQTYGSSTGTGASGTVYCHT